MDGGAWCTAVPGVSKSWMQLSDFHFHLLGYKVRGILQARILERVAIPFSRGSTQPRDQTWVSRIAGGFFSSWATKEAQPNKSSVESSSFTSMSPNLPVLYLSK